MSDQDRWIVDLTDVARDVRRVSRQPAQRVCRGDNVMPSLQQPLDDAIPARRVCESPVYENNRLFVTHLDPPPSAVTFMLPLPGSQPGASGSAQHGPFRPFPLEYTTS